MLTSAKGPQAPGHADGSGQEREFMGPPPVAGSLGFPDPYIYEGTAFSRLTLGYLRAISITSGQGGPGTCSMFCQLPKPSDKLSSKQFLNDFLSLLTSRRRQPGPTHVSIAGSSSAIDREGGGGAGTAAFREERYIPMVKGAHYVFADCKVSNIRAACTNTLHP